ncbi:MAG: MmcQ/YjbR family DNA-binding protein [Clostridia bacterium]
MEQYGWLDAYLLSMPGATRDYKIEWQWMRYQVGGHLFAALLHPGGQYDARYAGKDLLTLKCDPMESEFLRSQYAEILPGFYTDKRRWISLELGGELPHDMIYQLCASSYRLVFEKLPKRLQREIMETA